MRAINAFTDFGTVSLPSQENVLSRRYLRIIERWVPVAMKYYNDWPGRRDCGHFFGGVLWYGQETAMTIPTLALAAASPEFDPAVAGMSVAQIHQIVRRGLRYLCLTHDTGPADCLRPKESWGRPEPAGTKWGERGRGFFPESQCGRTIAGLAIAAALIQDLIGPQEREMLANIAADYLERFGTMPPRSGVYHDTQMEENGWTALGLAASLCLLPRHPKARELWQHTQWWMFRTATMPRDAHDQSPFADGRSVASLCRRGFTLLPDGTAENHGFVHPSYLASGISLSAMTANLMKLYGQSLPPHLFWHRQDIYQTMKPWFDARGAPHCVQGMDWPYFSYPGHAFLHAGANLYLYDADAALLERRTLETVERASVAHGGRMVPEDTVRHCHGQQDPALMRERLIIQAAYAYLAHRLMGDGQIPSDPSDFEKRLLGVHLYPHGGTLLHRHPFGINSLSWRNRTMVLPAPRDGMKAIGPAADTLLARLVVHGRTLNCRPVALRLREAADKVCALLVEDLSDGSVRRQVFFASLPNGKCLTVERLIARKLVTVERVDQGAFSIVNDAYFGDHPDLRGHRRLYWRRGCEPFDGYPLDSDKDDRVFDLPRAGWVNIDDRFGIVFSGTGRALYHNRHHYPVWHATEDELVLSRTDQSQEFKGGDRIAGLIALWCPEQAHDDTARQTLEIRPLPGDVFAVEVEHRLCVANFSDEPTTLSDGTVLPGYEPVIIEQRGESGE